MSHARVGACTWSLRPASPADLADKLAECGLSRVQLALEPLRTGAWDLEEMRSTLHRAGVSVASAMMEMRGEDYSTLESIRLTGGVRPDEHWEANLAAAAENAGLAHRLGLALVTFHAGFIPHPGDDDELRGTILDRLRRIADVFAERGLDTGLETGQERAETLAAALDELDHPHVGINFDPANMILYGMGDPVAALRTLAPHVRQIHVKDALPARSPGIWGEEVPAGLGAVDWTSFFAAYEETGLSCDLMIEREAGTDRVADIAAARALIERYGRGAAP